MSDYEKQMDLCKIKDIKAGQRIDTRDTEFIWCTAVVELKIQTMNREPLLYIHYEDWNRKYDEYIF